MYAPSAEWSARIGAASGVQHATTNLLERPIFDQDPVLLQRFRVGENAALSVVYRQHADAIGAHLAVLARSTGARELAQPSAIADLLQDVFARAFSVSARNSYDERRPYAPYLNAIAKNCFVDKLRKRRRDIPLELVDPMDVDLAPPSTDNDFDRTLRGVVETYVSGLSDQLRDVYEQRFAAGLTQEAACKALGITRRTLRTAEAHLKRGLRDALLLADLPKG